MNKTLGTFVQHGRLHLASAVVPERAGGERDEEPAGPGRRRPILNTLRRRAGLIAAVALAGTVLTGIAALSVPPAYTATAQLIVEPTSAEIAAALLGPVIDTHIAMLTSDRRLRRVLTERADGAAAGPAPAAAPPPLDARLRETLTAAATAVKTTLLPPRPEPEAGPGGAPGGDLASLKAALLVRQERLSSIVAVSARGRDPEEAATTVNRLVTLHVEELRDRKRRDAASSHAEQDIRIEAVRADLERAEDALKAFQAANGTASPDGDVDLIAEVQRQLALARTRLHEQQARLTRPGSAPESGEGAAETGRLEAEFAVRELGLRVSRLELQLQELQARSGQAFRQRLEQGALEQRIASARKLLDDLMQRRQEDPKDSARPFAAEARVFALASVPSRPSSINPFLLLPPACFAFGGLGIALALLRERMDRSLRSEREVEEIAGITCLGLVPRLRPHRLLHRSDDHDPAALLRERALASLARSLTRLRGDRGDHGAQVILVTAGRCDEDKRGLAAGLGEGLGWAGRRVLVMEASDHEDIAARGESCRVARDASHPFDRLATSLDRADTLLDRSGEEFRLLADRYDYVVVDAPPILSAMRVRVLAAMSDGVILGLRWGATRRETACEALMALRRSARFVGAFDVNAVAVLTDVDPRGYARFQSGLP
ncbi:MAG: Wzz/FepE/Etk N-terminal domain-containing protein [Methylobacterium frigidaeris]